MSSLFKAAVAAVFAVSAGSPAMAAVVDLTDNSSYDIERSGQRAAGSVYGGEVTWQITASSEGELLTYRTDGPGPGFDAPGDGIDLEGGFDGIGIGNDEISYPHQFLKLEFSEVVNLIGFAVLDLFWDQDRTSYEVANLYAEDMTGEPDAFLAADDVVRQGWGYQSVQSVDPLNLFGRVFYFSVGASNDAVGDPDFALAAFALNEARSSTPPPVNPPAVPLPAGIVLLLSGLAFLGMKRR